MNHLIQMNQRVEMMGHGAEVLVVVLGKQTIHGYEIHIHMALHIV